MRQVAHQHQRSFYRLQLSPGYQWIIIGRQTTDLPDLLLRRKESGHNFSRLFGSELVGMENLENANSLCRGGAGYLLNIFSPLIAQGPLGILGGRLGFTVSNQIKIHRWQTPRTHSNQLSAFSPDFDFLPTADC
jgi:hypothetical protein